MNWSEQVFQYCERGTDPAFMAEPANAITNVAFLIAAGFAWRLLRQQPANDRTPGHAMMIVLVGVIGVGSFLFHTMATQWAELADVAPIGVFMLAYMAISLSRFVGLHWFPTLLATMAFAVAIGLASVATCTSDPVSISIAGPGSPCLAGSSGYVPALLALFGIGALLSARGHPAGRTLLAAGTVFTISITFRMLDSFSCPIIQIAGKDFGTHPLWHCLNAFTLYLLLSAYIHHGRRDDAPVMQDKSAPAD